jgi:ATP-dependent RNA helicase DBP3
LLPACLPAPVFVLLLLLLRPQVEVLEQHARDDRLLSLLQQHHGSKGRKNRIIIFVLYKKEAPRLEGLLKRKGWNAAAIHGDISQAQRTAAVEAFKAGTVPLLIATGEGGREEGRACMHGRR